MARGGYRKGAGRKPGCPNVKKHLLAKVEGKLGLGPLDVILATMRHYMGVVEGQYRLPQGERDDKRLEAALGKATEAAALAAPYTNSRKATVAVEDVTPRPSVIRAPAVESSSAAWLEKYKPGPSNPDSINDLPSEHPARMAREGLEALEVADKVISNLRSH
jgi:hypothetical protein